MLLQQEGLQKSFQSLCNAVYPKPNSNQAYLPQLGLQLLFQMRGGHYTSGRKPPIFDTFILINGKTSIAESKYSLDAALTSDLFAGVKSWLRVNVFWPLIK